MNVLIDTNIVLDVLLNRQPWLRESHQVWQACDEGRIDGFLLASTVTDIFYIARKIIAGKQHTKPSRYAWSPLPSVPLIEQCWNRRST